MPAKETILFDFEGGNFDGWTLSGDCWDKQPATTKTFVDRQGQPLVSGILGTGYLTTLHSQLGAKATGKAVSKEFTIDKPFLIFRIGGGSYPNVACLNLIVDGKVVQSETGSDSAELRPAYWDVYALLGKNAHLEVVDNTTNPNRGYIMIDDVRPSDEPPGRANTVFKSFDDAMQDYMRLHNVPGGALCVVGGGKLLYARGYGYGDIETGMKFAPNSLFRIASISKFITHLGVMKLVEQHKLKLEAKAFRLLAYNPPPGGVADERIYDITIQQLIDHKGGWDRGTTNYDGTADVYNAAKALGIPPPAKAKDIVRYGMSKPLDFSPGEKSVYSNFGYCVLGRVIEKVTGERYEDWIRENVLKPFDITDMRSARTGLYARLPNEVRYYDANEKMFPSVTPGDKGAKVPNPYAWWIESLDASGGWVGSAVDLARIAATLDSARLPLLRGDTIHMMFAVTQEGWCDFGHGGMLEGAESLMCRYSNSLGFVIMFNRNVPYSGPAAGAVNPISKELQPVLKKIADAVTKWPAHDLFPEYGVKL